MDRYEDAVDKTWRVQLPLFVAEYDKVVRAAGRAAETADYMSKAALREDR